MRHFHLDRILSLQPGSCATGVRSVALGDDVFTEHFPGNPVLPGVYVLEGLAQTAGVLLWESSQRTRIAVMVSVDRARFTSFARPGDSLRLAVEIDSLEQEVARVRGTAMVGDRQVTVAAFTFSMQETARVIPPLYQPYWDQVVGTWLGEYPGAERAGA